MPNIIYVTGYIAMVLSMTYQTFNLTMKYQAYNYWLMHSFSVAILLS